MSIHYVRTLKEEANEWLMNTSALNLRMSVGGAATLGYEAGARGPCVQRVVDALTLVKGRIEKLDVYLEPDHAEKTLNALFSFMGEALGQWERDTK